MRQAERRLLRLPEHPGARHPSAELARRLLLEAGIACLSGTDFGAHGEGYLRLSYAASLDTIDEAIVRMRRFLSNGALRPST